MVITWSVIAIWFQQDLDNPIFPSVSVNHLTFGDLDLSKSDSFIENLLSELHSAGKLRVWSIIITLFGDAIAPRGGVIGLSSIQDVLQILGIEPNAVRTALSRLAKDGWIKRQKVGRQSFYLLTDDGLKLFETATTRIYAAGPPRWDGNFQLVICKDRDQKSRSKTLRTMRQKGFGSPSADLYVKPINKDEDIASEAVNELAVMRASDLQTDSLHSFVAETWQTSTLNLRYKKFLAKYRPIEIASKSGSFTNLSECLALRLMLIHDWRRLVLQDVDLPIELKPDDWLGEEARKLAAELYHGVLKESELFLDNCDASAERKLAKPTASLYHRFLK